MVVGGSNLYAEPIITTFYRQEAALFVRGVLKMKKSGIRAVSRRKKNGRTELRFLRTRCDESEEFAYKKIDGQHTSTFESRKVVKMKWTNSEKRKPFSKLREIRLKLQFI